MSQKHVIATLVIRVQDVTKFDPAQLGVGFAMLLGAFAEDGLQLQVVEFKIPRDANDGPEAQV